jgi:hypothetical protein
MVEGVVQVTECLANKYELPNSSPNTVKKERKERRKGEREGGEKISIRMFNLN